MLPPSFLLLALAPACNALTLPFNPVQRSGAYLQGLPYADRQRAGLLKSVGTGNTATIPATNLDFVQYTVSVGVGSPPTYYELVVDTGSSNTFVGCVMATALLLHVISSLVAEAPARNMSKQIQVSRQAKVSM